MEIFYSPQFLRDYKRLPQEIRDKVKSRGRIFQVNPSDPKLNTHKLHGKWDGFLAFSVDFRYRIIFSFRGKNSVKFHAVGGHEIYE